MPHVTHPEGLSDDEARRRLAAHGPNAIEDRERRGLAATLGEVAREPMFLLLLVAAAIYLL
ncbi:MAG TPA: cation-transporting P-type ATPase, partial [Ottowia sp.]|nr:cation-transporting P-type ATPase [Ottowia sp.]